MGDGGALGSILDKSQPLLPRGLPIFSSNAAECVSPADYLRLEQQAASKHECFQGEIWAMVGAGFAQNHICANLTIAIGSQLLGAACTPVGSDQHL